MTLVRYEAPEPLWGVLHKGHITQLGATAKASEVAALQWLESGSAGAPCALEPVIAGDESLVVPLASVRLLPPLVGGASVYCIGFNYRSHIAESGREIPPHPTVFVRTASSLVGAADALWRPRVSECLDFEGELAVVIGRGGRHIAEADALSHIGALTCFNDGSVRDYQQHSLAAGKNFHRRGACGPWLVRPADAGDMNALPLATRLNGQVVQRSSTDMLIYPIARLVSYLSSVVALRTGDVIATGTPEGVGFRRVPPLWLRPGDRIDVEVGGVGCLANHVEDEPAA